MLWIKQLLTGLLVLAMTAGLTGCAAGENPRVGYEHEPVTIVSGGMDYTQFQALLAEKYPEIRLEVVSYAGANTSEYMEKTLAVGDIPDIYTTTYFTNGAAQEEYLLDLSGYDFVNNYSTPMLDSMEVDGHVYLLPSGYVLSGIYYNKTLFEENGWQVPGSFAELLELAPQIEAAGYDVCRAAMDETGEDLVGDFFGLGNTVLFGTAGGKQWKQDFLSGNATAQGTVEPVLEYMQKWIDAGFISRRDTGGGAYTAFLSGGCALLLGQDFRLGAASTGYEFGLLPWLSEDGQSNMLVRNVSRYYGLSKSLAEEGNEQKLEDALKVLELMATTEGQEALAGDSENIVPPLKLYQIDESSPYYEVKDLVSGGYMVQIVHTGWESYIPSMADALRGMARGETDIDGVVRAMDEVNREVTSGSKRIHYASVTERFTLEQTAELCGTAIARAAGTDAALVSLGDFHDGKENPFGVNCPLYEGAVSDSVVLSFFPDSERILVLQLTGRELEELAQQGFDKDGNGNAYPYVLSLPRGRVLEAETVYSVAVPDTNLTVGLRNRAEQTELEVFSAIRDYLSSLDVVTPEGAAWKQKE